MDYPGNYVLMALTSDLVWHCYQVTLGNCPDEGDFTITPSGCTGSSSGTICISSPEWLGSTFACSGLPSADGCVIGIGAGINYCLLAPPALPGLSISYLNMELDVPSTAFSVSFTETPYADPLNPCQGASVTATVSGGSGNFGYEWSVPTWLSGSIETNYINFGGGYGYINLVVTDAETGCVVESQYAFLGNNCQGYDVNNNGVVNVSDLIAFMASFGTTSGGCADFDGNGVVNISDLLMFMSFGFGVC